MKKTLFALLGAITVFGLASCAEPTQESSSTQAQSTETQEEMVLFDNPAKDVDHYFTNKVNLANTGATVKTMKVMENGVEKEILAGDFIKDGIARVELKSVTDGDTAVFHLTKINPEATHDTYTVKTKDYTFVTLRFMGIDTPESTSSIEPWGKAASNYGKALLRSAAGIIIDATDLPGYDSQRGYLDRLDSNGSRWLGLVWYCPEGQDPNKLENYRSYQLDMIEACYTENAVFNTKRAGYLIDSKEEPVLYERYNFKDENGIPRMGTISLSEVFFEANNRMAKAAKQIKVHGENDPSFDYDTTPKAMTITEAKKNNVELQQKGTFVQLTGVITRFIGNNFYFEDAQGSALYVYMGIDGNSINDLFNVGDTIQIQGRICTFGGQLQMSGIKFKKDTFVKITDPNKVIPMPKPIVLTGNETYEEIQNLMGKLVTMEINNDYTGNQSKNGAFSITNDKVMKNHPLLSAVTTTATPGSKEWDEACMEQLGIQYPALELQVRIDGNLRPGYLDRFDEFKKGYGKGNKYKVTGIMSVFYEADYTVKLTDEHEDWLYSYQIMVGNAYLDGKLVNEIVKLS